jgi:hypothetical protein
MDLVGQDGIELGAGLPVGHHRDPQRSAGGIGREGGRRRSVLAGRHAIVVPLGRSGQGNLDVVQSHGLFHTGGLAQGVIRAVLDDGVAGLFGLPVDDDLAGIVRAVGEPNAGDLGPSHR